MSTNAASLVVAAYLDRPPQAEDAELVKWVAYALLGLVILPILVGGKIYNMLPGARAQLCPGGFRLLTNFGYDAMQSQEHGHLHILGGTYLGHYVG